MIGLRQIEAVRRDGWKPALVFFDVGPAPAGRKTELEKYLEMDLDPQVYTDGDSPVRADLRLLSGVKVHLYASTGSQSDFLAWLDALMLAGAVMMSALGPDGTAALYPPYIGGDETVWVQP